jgi:hypothetical protein
MKEVTPNLFRCQFLARGLEFLQFSETRQLGERVFYWAVFIGQCKKFRQVSMKVEYMYYAVFIL